MAAPARVAATCSAAVYKMVPFMQHPAPANNIFELLGPVWWAMDGQSLSTYAWSSFWPQLIAYAKSNGKAAFGGLAALCALMLLSLVVFVMWRFVRCIRVVCCQQESYADANKVLFSRRLRLMKGLTIALGLAACGAAAWGMISLNKHILPDLNARIDSMQELPTKVVKQVSGLAVQTAALSTPLSNISSILSSMDCEGLRQNVQHVTAFLTEAPSPTTLKVTLQKLSSALKPELYEGLRQLQGHVNIASPNSPLAILKKHVEALAEFDMSTMGPAIRSYSDSLSAVYELVTSSRKDKEVQASSEFAKLKAAYDRIDLDRWVPYIDQAMAAANAINAMRSPSTNPFTITLKAISNTQGTIDNIRGNLLGSLSAEVTKFNGLWHNNASNAFESLFKRATHINHTILELPRDVESQLVLVNASIRDFTKLYSANESLLTLPQRIDDAGNKLVMPNASQLITDLQAAEAELNNAQGLSDLVAKLATLARALDRTLRDAKGNIQPNLDAFVTDSSIRMDLVDTLTFEGPVVEGAATLFESYKLDGVKRFADTVLGKIDAMLEPATRQAEGIPGILVQINDFNINTFVTPLQQAEAVYKQFQGNPANLTKPVLDMLDQVTDLQNNDLVGAQALVTNVSDSVQELSSKIQSAAVEQVDQFQVNHLGKTAGGSAKGSKGTHNLIKTVHAVYYAVLGSYAVVLGLVVVLMVMAVFNCAAGVCFSGFFLSTALALFSALPLVITIGLLLLRDTCGNMETLTSKAVAHKAGNSSVPAAVSDFYLFGASTAGGNSLPAIIKGANAEYDVEGFKTKVQQAVDNVLTRVTNDFTLRAPVSAVVHNATHHIESVLHSMDSLMLTLDQPSVSAVYYQGKNFFCCNLANQIYTQWAASITVVALAWAAMLCAWYVLRSLDLLSASCCRFRPYRTRDYGAAPGAGSSRMRSPPVSPRKVRLIGEVFKPLQPMDSNSSETVAVISLGGAALADGNIAGKGAAPGKTVPVGKQTTLGGSANNSVLPECTPLPAPLLLRTAPTPAVMPSPRRTAALTTLDTSSAKQQRQLITAAPQSTQVQQQQQQQHPLHTSPASMQRRSRVGDTSNSAPKPHISITAVYPSPPPPFPGSPTAAQREQNAQQWANTQGMPGKGLLRAPCTRI